jgi:hypothetical protein
VTLKSREFPAFLHGNIIGDQLFNTDFPPVMSLDSKPLHSGFVE